MSAPRPTIVLTGKLADLIAAAEALALARRIHDRARKTLPLGDPARPRANAARIQAEQKLDSAARRFGRDKAAKEFP